MQHAAADLLFDRGNLFWRQCRGLSELDPAGLQWIEDPVEDAAVVVEVAIERCTEAVDEAHRPEARLHGGPRTAFPQMGLDHAQEDVQHGGDRLWPPLQRVAQALGHRQHPLPHR